MLRAGQGFYLNMSMLTIHPWGAAPGVLQEVLRVQSDDPAVAGYYVRINGCLYSTHLVGSPEGVGLWQVDELPGRAIPEPRAEGLLGLEVRRVMIAAWTGDDTQLALVLDLGRQNYLEFYELVSEEPARNMRVSPDCGEVEEELTFGVQMPYVREVAPEVLRYTRLVQRLISLGVALFLSSTMVLVFCRGLLWAEIAVALGIGLTGLGVLLGQRKFACPWCGEKAFGVGGGIHHYLCDHCNNGLDSDRMKH